MPKSKALENLKADHEVMEQKFIKVKRLKSQPLMIKKSATVIKYLSLSLFLMQLQLERDKLSKSVSEKIQSVTDEGDLLEVQLQSLEDHLEEVQA